MPEHQNSEYKESWKDDYLKWICSFANAQGGHLYIGINDRGIITGITNYKKLLDDLPNKISAHLGLTVDVNLLEKDSKYYIEIIVIPSHVAISYRGSYYYRSGSTTQELKGTALQEFILSKMGRSWDDMPVASATIDDINKKTLKKFTDMALQQGRISVDATSDSIESVLKNLHLITEKGELKCAAVLLFGKEPQRYFRHAYFKIGKFGQTDHDLEFQDVIEGNVFDMLDSIMTILRSKYLKALITYEGTVRKENLEYPEEALREALLNAIVHKDYSNTFIQLSVYDDKLILWNPGVLPEALTIEKLKAKHASHPRNKNIAEIFFKAGFIEAWGRGISKIIDSFKIAGLPEPNFAETEGGFRVTLVKDKLSQDNLIKLGLNERQLKAISHLKKFAKITNANYVEINKVSKSTAYRELRDMQDKNILKSTGKKGAGSEFILGS